MSGHRRYLVTGALGAVGVWTMRRLLERGHGVVALDLGGSDHRLALALEPEQRAAIERVECDIADLAALEAVLDARAITNVIHLAALQVPFVRANPPLGALVDVVGTVNVLEAVRRRAERIGPVVYASSIAVYGQRATLAGDDVPGTLYGVFKRDNESTALRYFEDYGLSSIGLRPHTVFGPARDQGLTSAPTTALLAAAARVPYVLPFASAVQYQYAPDVGAAFALAAELEYEGASVHNLDGEVAGAQELIALIEQRVPEMAGRIGAEDVALPFPSAVDAASFVELAGGPVMRPLADGVADAIDRFERLLAAGLVEPPRAAAPS